MPADFAIPPDAVALADYERYARERLDPRIWAYVAGSGGDGLTQRRNRDRLDAILLQSRVLADFSAAGTQIELFGTKLASPLLVAPMAYHTLAHPDGEIATALGAGAMQAPLIVSCQASRTIEDIKASAHAPLWLQLYLHFGRDTTLDLIQRAEGAGYGALVVTVDASVNGVRNIEQRAGFALPENVKAVNLVGANWPKSRAGPGQSPVFRGLLHNAPTWDDIAWIKQQTSLPILLKGILNPADALRALELGADGIVVSNHGGRALDTLPAAIEALPRVANAVADRVPVLMDGGVRRGTDVLKALALGASAVMVGQPILHGLAVGGAPGVAHILSILNAQLEVAMALTGRPTVADIDETVIWRAD